MTSFQFLGIPPKGEQEEGTGGEVVEYTYRFPISRDPPEGGTVIDFYDWEIIGDQFPISRDPPEGGTVDWLLDHMDWSVQCFQFLGIPPKGEHQVHPFMGSSR